MGVDREKAQGLNGPYGTAISRVWGDKDELAKTEKYWPVRQQEN